MSYFDLEGGEEVLKYIDGSNLDPDKDIPTIIEDVPPIKLNIAPVIPPIEVNNLALMVPARKALLREGKTPNLKHSSNIKALISTRYSLNLVSRVITTTTTANPFTPGPSLALPTNKGKGKGKEIDLIGPKPSLRKGLKRIAPENISLTPQSKKPRTLTPPPIKKPTPVKKPAPKKPNPQLPIGMNIGPRHPIQRDSSYS
ncbi:hypothetical protein F5882DRAFT_386707 [Hyaloscypha sp. PMI_1271]|nr:hypothetical protein F5882DRAFT_386707 [Hyaloscypha sp. PMI_1271]